MQPFVRLDENIKKLLCCPVCKGILGMAAGKFVCEVCYGSYLLVDGHGGPIYDFRIHHPSYLIPHSVQQWNAIQKKYEAFDGESAGRDNLQEYLDEIDSVKEIYTTDFQISGSVLDVGGHQGRLRHYLSKDDLNRYVSVDPLIESFRSANKPNLMKAYPCLSLPCNFLSCYAENLPFKMHSFDWVHMRSVVDHFADPYAAFKEAYRVLKPDGHLLIGLAIEKQMAFSYIDIVRRVIQKTRSGGVLFALKSIFGKLGHDHNFRLTHETLCDLLSVTGFEVVKEQWQKSPYSYVIYLSARKRTVG